ncbi:MULTISPECIES: response regulator transcription factor [unclassified Micromonospora]|uniref:LuxR C-terminal-related transcriptional regulator n=1 Tax=unclassified Micromonospora TaxID=2617518 RepID=UPI00249B806E|nr:MULTISPECIES: response regulator transcription factor [unclassified Micromonospora]WFE54808.1 response regulator transcription factor [Micromonospora sp. WMMD1155]WFE98670.1 response regulator transcription factor [Micromonospora sp. WMMD964]
MTTVIVLDGYPTTFDRIIDVLRAPRLAHDVVVVNSVDVMCMRLRGALGAVGLVPIELSAGDLSRLATAPGNRGRHGGVIVVTAFESAGEMAQAISAGARGVLLLDSPPEEVMIGVRAVAAGHPFVPPSILATLATALCRLACAHSKSTVDYSLTDRELDVLSLLAQGHPNKQIAQNLFISAATVHSHVLSILRKLGVNNRTQAVVFAQQQGLLCQGHAALGALAPQPTGGPVG